MALGALLAVAAGPTLAQGFPGGGMGGPGGMGGGPPTRGKAETAAAQRVPSLDDLMPADPWRLWLDGLTQARDRLALAPEALRAYDAFTHELRDAQQLNMRRVDRAVRHQPVRVSAVVDVARDLREEQEAAGEWQAALGDLAQRWQGLAVQLTPAQRGQVQSLYADALARARAAARAPAGGAGADEASRPQPRD